MNVRPVRVDGRVAYVSLTKGYEAVIDAEDVPLISGHNWMALVCSGVVYAYRSGPSRERPRKAILMHRVILGAPEGLLVDHKDRDGLNNRKSNIRIATRSENNTNQRLAVTNKSGFKGVSWCRNSRRWRCQIRHNGKKVWLGTYDDPAVAAAAYAEASAKFHGEFGRTS